MLCLHIYIYISTDLGRYSLHAALRVAQQARRRLDALLAAAAKGIAAEIGRAGRAPTSGGRAAGRMSILDAQSATTTKKPKHCANKPSSTKPSAPASCSSSCCSSSSTPDSGMVVVASRAPTTTAASRLKEKKAGETLASLSQREGQVVSPAEAAALEAGACSPPPPGGVDEATTPASAPAASRSSVGALRINTNISSVPLLSDEGLPSPAEKAVLEAPEWSPAEATVVQPAAVGWESAVGVAAARSPRVEQQSAAAERLTPPRDDACNGVVREPPRAVTPRFRAGGGAAGGEEKDVAAAKAKVAKAAAVIKLTLMSPSDGAGERGASPAASPAQRVACPSSQGLGGGVDNAEAWATLESSSLKRDARSANKRSWDDFAVEQQAGCADVREVASGDVEMSEREPSGAASLKKGEVACERGGGGGAGQATASASTDSQKLLPSPGSSSNGGGRCNGWQTGGVVVGSGRAGALESGASRPDTPAIIAARAALEQAEVVVGIDLPSLEKGPRDAEAVCLLCPIKGGAFLRADRGRKGIARAWCHCLCALSKGLPIEDRMVKVGAIYVFFFFCV